MNMKVKMKIKMKVKMNGKKIAVNISFSLERGGIYWVASEIVLNFFSAKI
jgi:hypothetical protein